MDAAPEKQQAHELIDRLEPAQLSAVVCILKRIVEDPVSQAIANALPDDEPVSDGERQALARSEAWFEQRGGKGVPIEEVLAEFGLTLDNFPNDSQQRGP